MHENLLKDKRLIERHIKRGLITQEEYDAVIEGLPDVAEIASGFEAEMVLVGLATVAAKDIGEHD